MKKKQSVAKNSEYDLRRPRRRGGLADLAIVPPGPHHGKHCFVSPNGAKTPCTGAGCKAYPWESHRMVGKRLTSTILLSGAQEGPNCATRAPLTLANYP